MMVRPTTNVGLISKILGEPLHTLPDSTVFLLLEAGDKIIGLAMLKAFDSFLGIIDAVVLAKYREEKELLTDVVTDLNEHVKSAGFGKVIALIPSSRKNIMGFFQRGGYKREGVLKDSCVINGAVEHQTILGISWD